MQIELKQYELYAFDNLAHLNWNGLQNTHPSS